MAERKRKVTWRSNGALQATKPFVLGGLSGMTATAIIQPLDLVKVRIQLSGEGGKGKVNVNPLYHFRQVIAEDGFLYLYNGLSAGLLRQATYCTARIGLFRTFSDMMATGDGVPLPFYKKVVAGLASGGIGSIIGTPCDVALVRMQSDSVLPVSERRGYTSVFNALSRMVKEEGAGTLFRGCSPVVVRAMFVNVGMMSTYDQAKEVMGSLLDSPLAINASAKVASGFFASAFSLPWDFMKTRIQKQKPDPKTGELPYRGLLHCMQRVATEEGIGAFYRGFWTYYGRIAPHCMITLVALDIFESMLEEDFIDEEDFESA